MVMSVCKDGTNAVLVLDAHTSAVLSSCCRMYDVMDVGVLALQSIAVSRERLAIPAIYFLEPTKESVDALIEDFRDAKTPSCK
jgi:hypothetical protein